MHSHSRAVPSLSLCVDALSMRHLIQCSLLHGEQLSAVVEPKPSRVARHHRDVISEAEHDEAAQGRQVLLVRGVLDCPVVVDVRQEYAVLLIQAHRIGVLHDHQDVQESLLQEQPKNNEPQGLQS